MKKSVVLFMIILFFYSLINSFASDTANFIKAEIIFVGCNESVPSYCTRQYLKLKNEYNEKEIFLWESSKDDFCPESNWSGYSYHAVKYQLGSIDEGFILTNVYYNFGVNITNDWLPIYKINYDNKGLSSVYIADGTKGGGEKVEHLMASHNNVLIVKKLMLAHKYPADINEPYRKYFKVEIYDTTSFENNYDDPAYIPNSSGVPFLGNAKMIVEYYIGSENNSYEYVGDEIKSTGHYYGSNESRSNFIFVNEEYLDEIDNSENFKVCSEDFEIMEESIISSEIKNEEIILKFSTENFVVNFSFEIE